jgi:hypothetical protein
LAEVRSDAPSENYTGIFVNHHKNGAVSQVLHYVDGRLDGLAEFYDDQGRLLERWLYRRGELVPSSELAPLVNQRLGEVEPRPPLPLPSPIPGAGPPGRFLARPPHRPQFEIGFDVPLVYGIGSYSSFFEAGLLSQFHLAISVQRWLWTEFALAWMPNLGFGDRNFDWPIGRVGLRVPLLNGKWSPYLLGGLSLTYGQAVDPTSDPKMPSYDSAWYVGLDGGLGFALRLGEHLVLTTDVRAGRNLRIDGGPHLLAPDASGTPQEVMGSYYFITTNLGLGVRL